MRLALSVIMIATLALSACGSRGNLAALPEESPATKRKTVLVATSRAPAPAPAYFGDGRSYATNYAAFEVSIPPDRAPGEVTYPTTERIDPQSQFLVASFKSLDGSTAFVRAINHELAAQDGISNGSLFVHGFNTNFAEGVMRDVALVEDTGRKGLSVVYSWPSAGSVLKYLDDRESALFARDSLRETLEAMSRSKLSNYLLVGHSMGTFVVMDTLRELAKQNEATTLRKIRAVVLISADLDVDVFRKQAPAVLAAGVPIILVTTQDDLALSLSARIRGQSDRVGDITDQNKLGGLDVPVFDLSNVESSGGLKHFKIGSTPEILEFLRVMNESGQGVLAGNTEGPLITVGAAALERATNVVLSD